MFAYTESQYMGLNAYQRALLRLAVEEADPRVRFRTFASIDRLNVCQQLLNYAVLNPEGKADIRRLVYAILHEWSPEQWRSILVVLRII